MARKKIIIIKLLPEKSFCIKLKWGKEASQNYLYTHIDWDPDDWKEAQSGDEFFLIQYKDNSTGIIMHGKLHSDAKDYGPFPGTRKGIYGTYLIADQHINEEKYRLLSTDTLQAAMPEINWGPGPSGWKVTGPYIKKLRRMWREYLEMNDNFNNDNVTGFVVNSPNLLYL